MAARTLNTQLEVESKWISMTREAMSFSSPVLGALIYTFSSLDFCFLFTF